MFRILIPTLHCHLCYSKLLYKFKQKDVVPNLENDEVIFEHDRNFSCNNMNFIKNCLVKDYLVSLFN